MKATLLTLGAALIMSCATIKKQPTEGWSSTGNYVLYQQDTVALLVATELSIDNKRWVKELTFRLISMKHADKSKELLWFVHKKHPDYEVELDLPLEAAFRK